MTGSMWGPDGQWVGRPSAVGRPGDEQPVAPVEAPLDDVERGWRLLGCGCLVLVGLALLLPTLAFAVFAAISSFDEEADTALATVVEVGPGVDDAGAARPYCFTVEYVVERTRTHHTCDTLSMPKVVVQPGTQERDFESHDAQQRRFAEEHPVGSTVKLLYEVDDPDQVRGPISEVGFSRSGGGRVPALVAGTGALVCLVAIVFAFRTARRLSRGVRAR